MPTILVNSAVKERKSRASGKSLAISLVIGLIFIIIGIIPIATFNPAPNPGPPTCNGQVMGPDDICDEYTNGVLTNSYTYDQMLAREQPHRAVNYGWGFGLIAVGALIGGLGIGYLRPGKPWGRPRTEPCPRCGRPRLREKPMSYSRRTGYRQRTTWRSTVVLCDEQCGFATLYKPGTAPQLA